MGFFEKLKNFFADEIEEPKTESYTPKELESWLVKEAEVAFQNANQKIKELRATIAQEKNQLALNLTQLEKAELKNDQIPARVKQIMHGNRQTYLQRMNTLAEQITVPLEFIGLVRFTTEFEKNITEFEKSIAKNHHVMLEFFVKEATAVSTSIKNLDKHVKDIKRTMEENKIFKIEELKEKVKKLQKTLYEQANLANQIEETKNQLDAQAEKIEQQEEHIEEIKASKEYQTFIERTQDQEKITRESKNLHAQIIHSFSEIETALKKYANARPDDKLIQCYLDDPLKTMREDTNLEIVKILKKLRNAVEINEIELKEKKKEKTIRELEKLTEYHFKNVLRRQKELETNREKIEHEINTSEINKQLKKLKDKIKNENTKLTEARLPLKKLQKEHDEKELQITREEIEHELMQTFNQEIKIN